MVSIQKMFKLSRLEKDKNYFGGSGYWSIHKDAAAYILDELKTDSKRWRYTFCPEECAYQTILLNSRLKDTIVNNNLRYVVWHEKHKELPGILDETDFEKIKATNYLFARKFDSKISNQLLKSLFTDK